MRLSSNDALARRALTTRAGVNDRDCALALRALRRRGDLSATGKNHLAQFLGIRTNTNMSTAQRNSDCRSTACFERSMQPRIDVTTRRDAVRFLFSVRSAHDLRASG